MQATIGHTEKHSPGVVIRSKLHYFQTHHCPVSVASTPVRAHKTLITWSIYRDLQVERTDRSVWPGCCDKTARIMWILWIASATYRQPQREHIESVLCVFCVLPLQHWACVRSRSPAPQPAHHPPLLSSFLSSLPLPLSVRLGRSARPQQSLLPGELSLQRWLRKCPGRSSCCPEAAERWPAASRHLLSLHSDTIST